MMLRPWVLISVLALAACSPEATKPTVAPAPAATYGAVYGATGKNEVIAEFKAAMEARDFDAMASLSMPPSLLEQIKKQSNIPPNTNASLLRGQIVAGLKSVMDQAKTFEMSIDDGHSKIETTAAGRSYALVLSSVLMEVQGAKVRSTNNYLALDDGGRWFLINPSNAGAIQAIKTTYPDLADVPLTEPNMEMVSQ